MTTFVHMINEQTTYLIMWKRVSTILLIAFTLQLANNALFYHTHKTIDGVTYAHAHPFNGRHTHDFQKCYLFDHFVTISFDATQYSTKVKLYGIEFHFKTLSPLWTISLFHDSVDGRAPPIA